MWVQSSIARISCVSIFGRSIRIRSPGRIQNKSVRSGAPKRKADVVSRDHGVVIVELALGGSMLRDVRQPQLVRSLGGEHVPFPAVLIDDRAKIVVHRRTGPAVLAALGFPERAEPAVAGRDPTSSHRHRGLRRRAGDVRTQGRPGARRTARSHDTPPPPHPA